MERGCLLSKFENKEILSRVLESIKTKINGFNYNNWFQHASFSFTNETNVEVIVPNKFVRDWISDNYLELLKFEFFKACHNEITLSFKIQAPSQTQVAAEEKQVQKTQPKTKQRKENPAQASLFSPQVQARQALQGLNERYSFKDFVVGSSNQFVSAACQAVAQNPGKNYNPLFIYGGVGLGKTHLLNAIGLEALRKNPHTRLVYVSGEEFTNEVINSIRYDKTYQLRRKYRDNCDLLLIDDVQFIAGKERTMEEFFHTFNALYESRKQIIMTSDSLPKDIQNLAERLRSRFSWGLLADIQKPDFETRCAILQKKSEQENIQLRSEVCNYIAEHVQTNVRDLEGCLVRISAFASLASLPITIQLASEVLKDYLQGFHSNLSIDKIQKAVATYYNLKVPDLKSKRRHRNLALPRQIAMYLCKKHVKASYPNIGQEFGGKDHTTVIHAYQKISKVIDSDDSIQNDISKIESKLSML